MICKTENSLPSQTAPLRLMVLSHISRLSFLAPFSSAPMPRETVCKVPPEYCQNSLKKLLVFMYAVVVLLPVQSVSDKNIHERGSKTQSDAKHSFDKTQSRTLDVWTKLCIFCWLCFRLWNFVACYTLHFIRLTLIYEYWARIIQPISSHLADLFFSFLNHS